MNRLHEFVRGRGVVPVLQGWVKSGHQDGLILFLLFLTTSASFCRKISRNLGPTFSPSHFLSPPGEVPVGGAERADLGGAAELEGDRGRAAGAAGVDARAGGAPRQASAGPRHLRQGVQEEAKGVPG